MGRAETVTRVGGRPWSSIPATSAPSVALRRCRSRLMPGLSKGASLKEAIDEVALGTATQAAQGRVGRPLTRVLEKLQECSLTHCL